MYNLRWRASDAKSGRVIAEEWLGLLNDVCGSGEGLDDLDFLDIQALRDFLQFAHSVFWILERVHSLEVIDKLVGARALRYDSQEHVFLAWFGGHGIHAYSADSGREVAFWNVGNFARDDARRAVVRQSMDDHLQHGDYPWAY